MLVPHMRTAAEHDRHLNVDSILDLADTSYRLKVTSRLTDFLRPRRSIAALRTTFGAHRNLENYARHSLLRYDESCHLPALECYLPRT